MKKVFVFLLLFMMLFSLTAQAAVEVTVLLDGEPMEFDVPAQIIGDRTMVPMRKIFESLGAEVQWVGEEQLIIAAHKTNIITMEIGKETFTITNVLTNETTIVSLDVPPQIVENRTLVPARAVSEALGMTVDWNGDTYTVTIDSTGI